MEANTREMGTPLREPTRPNLLPNLVLNRGDRGLLPTAPSRGPGQAPYEKRPLRGRPDLRLHLRTVRSLRAYRGGAPSSLCRWLGVGVGPGDTPRGSLLLQGREG